MTRQPLSPEAKAEFNATLRRAVEYLERPKKPEQALTGVLAELEREPREA